MQNLLAAGEQIEAEVVSIREAASVPPGVAPDHGQRTPGHGRSQQQQTRRARHGAGRHRIVRYPSAGHAAAAGRQPASMIDLQQLPVGSVIQGRVVATSQQRTEDGQTSFKIVVSLLNSPVAGQKLSIESANPLALAVFDGAGRTASPWRFCH